MTMYQIKILSDGITLNLTKAEYNKVVNTRCKEPWFELVKTYTI